MRNFISLSSTALLETYFYPLQAQADERARRLKAELERKRREAYELEQQRLQALAKAKAAPVMPMTDAMKAIGAAKVPQPVL